MTSIPAVQDKCWGDTRRIFDSAVVSVDVLNVVAGWQCSRHWHDERANRFHVVSGIVIVRSWNKDGVETVRKLYGGESTTVESGITHRFECVESGVMLEIYWPDKGGELRAADIQRLDEGGPIPGFAPAKILDS